MFLSCAAILDPRLKVAFVSYCYGKLYQPDDAQRRVDEVKKTLFNLFAEYSGGGVREENIAADAGNTSRGADMLNDYEQYMETQRTHVEKSQLELYLDEPTRGLNEKLDVLEFWSKSSMRYPQLASMARDILAVPISSVASESAFSLSRKIITPNRASLKPKTIEALMCLQDWVRWKMAQEGNELINVCAILLCFLLHTVIL